MKTHSPYHRPELNFEYPFRLSSHSIKRKDQRAIRRKDIQLALHYTESFFKQGLVFHVVKNSMIPEDMPEDMVQRIKNMVIVMAGDEAKVITCYRSEKGMRRIKKKSCRLAPSYEINNVA